MSRVLIIDAHGDDALLGMGGTIARHTKHWKNAVRCLILTDGASTQYPGQKKLAKQRNQEIQNACNVLGIQETFHIKGFPDMRLDTVAHVRINKVIEQHVRDFKPDALYCVHPDANMDHQCLFSSAIVAARPTPNCYVRKFVTYAPLSSTEWDVAPAGRPFNPNLFVDITETIDDKIEAMKCMPTELRDYPHPRSLEGIRVFAQREGSRVGMFYAEPLFMMREIQ